MYEHRKHKLLSRAAFARRVIHHIGIACAALGAVLGMGVLGYHYFGELSWLDSLLDASMLLGGLGPMSQLHTISGKLFASFYSLYCGLVFIGVAYVLIAPFAHRLLHHLHFEDEDR